MVVAAADQPDMGMSHWTRETIAAFVEGKRLFVRDVDAQQIPPPEWLAPAANEINKLDSSESVDATHPDDRNKLIEAFVGSLSSPGVPVDCLIRIYDEDAWQHSMTSWLNLLDHPDVGAIICAAWEVEGPEFEVPETTIEGNMAASNWMVVGLDDHGYIVSTRGRSEEMLGLAEHELKGHLLTEYIHPDCVGAAIENWLRLQANPEQTRTARWVWLHEDGSEPWFESSYLVHNHDLVEVIIFDVDEQVANEKALAASQAEVAALAEDFRLLADEVPTAVFRCDATGRVEFHNAQWSEMFSSIGPVDRVQDVIAPGDRSQFDQLLVELTKCEAAASQSIEVAGAGEVRVLEIRCRAGGGSEGDRFVGSIADVTAAAHFRHQALHDQLTGLGNRTLIEAQLDEAIRTDPEGTLVVFIDLDGFKAVNDDHGHDAGDAVLVEVARRLSASLRPGDAVARYGGDEFVVVCRGVSPDRERLFLDRLRAAVFVDDIELDGLTWVPAASLGVARPEPGIDSATVLRRADRAMFDEKRSRQG